MNPAFQIHFIQQLTYGLSPSQHGWLYFKPLMLGCSLSTGQTLPMPYLLLLSCTPLGGANSNIRQVGYFLWKTLLKFQRLTQSFIFMQIMVQSALLKVSAPQRNWAASSWRFYPPPGLSVPCWTLQVQPAGERKAEGWREGPGLVKADSTPMGQNLVPLVATKYKETYLFFWQKGKAKTV